MQHRSVRVVAAAATLALMTAACGGGKEIGGDLKADGSKQGGSGAIGQATTTTAAPVVTTAAPAATIKPTVTTASQPSAVFAVQDDTKGQYIEPLHHSVRAASLVRFTNTDDTPHTINLKIGATSVYKSPTMAPGGTWDVRPTTKGNYDIVDEERTYAVGATLTVTG